MSRYCPSCGKPCSQFGCWCGWEAASGSATPANAGATPLADGAPASAHSSSSSSCADRETLPDDEMFDIRTMAAEHGWTYVGSVRKWLHSRLTALNEALKVTNARNAQLESYRETRIAAGEGRQPEPIYDAVVFVLLLDEAHCGECQGYEFGGAFRDFMSAASTADREARSRGARKTKRWIKDETNRVDAWHGDRAKIIRHAVLPRGGSIRLTAPTVPDPGTAEGAEKEPDAIHLGEKAFERAMRLWQAERESLRADVARLSSQLHEAQQEIAALEERWETHDSAVCPEDVGCVEYIGILERRIAVFKQERAHQEVERLTGQVSHLSSQLALLRAGDEPGVWPCGCQARVDALGVPTPLENDARCDYHLGMASQLAGMRAMLDFDSELHLGELWSVQVVADSLPRSLTDDERAAVKAVLNNREQLANLVTAAREAAQAPTPQETRD